MDDLDQAQQFETMHRDEAIRRARQMGIGVGPAPAGPRECEDCGNEIPQARGEAVPGATKCIGCQEASEG